jgi:ubiquinone/menaquinone biosynthesis C-methylase UbiE
MELVIGLVGLGVGAFLVWWLIFESEGVYLGKRVVVWLYDVYARRYDAIKQYDPLDEFGYLAHPLLLRLAPQTDPLVLDVATGTGRVPLALLQHPAFVGHIIALDASRAMLTVAAEKFSEGDEVTLIWRSAERLPLDAAAVDVVTCLEALEFMPQPGAVLRELCRVLRPQGLLLITLRINTRWLPRRTWNEETLQNLLEQAGMEQVEIETWQRDYRLVWARKVGAGEWLGACLPEMVLRCPQCGQSTLAVMTQCWQCRACEATLAVEQGIVDFMTG